MEVNTKDKKNKHKNTMATTMMKEEEEEEEEEEDYYYSSTYSSCSCFFCVIKHPNPRVRRSSLSAFFREMPSRDRDEDVLVMSSLWSTAMAEPADAELPSAGALRCMSLLIDRGISDPSWLRRRQNVYIPYYAAHVLGSYTLRSPSLAFLAVDAGAVAPLLGLLRGRMTWVEQRVAVRALGHLASYDATFPAVARHAEEAIALAALLASSCADTVYREFVAAKAREKYHRDLLTRGLGGAEAEDRKAEEWASQMQRWSLCLLSCFAWKDEMYHGWMCRDAEFLKKLCKMWGGTAACGDTLAAAGLMRILCRSDVGRKAIAGCKEVVDSLCDLSRSSDDAQYMGIDCLLLLVSDPSTRTKVRDAAVPCLLDLAELRSLGSRKRLGRTIADVLSSNFDLREELMVERRREEGTVSDEELMKRKSSATALKREGNEAFFSGDVEEAVLRYTEALEQCPLRMRKERMVLYSNRAQCRLLMQEPDAAISDATRGLSLSSPANGHGKSLWRRAQAYDMKGMARESLTDCVVFVGGRVDGKRAKVPYFAARMISKQASAVGLFAASARTKRVEEKTADDAISAFGLPTIEEEPTTPRKEGEKGKEAKRGFHDSTTIEGMGRHHSLMYSRR